MSIEYNLFGSKLIKSISYNQCEIIENILNLHCKGNQIDLDPTYSIGNFYNGRIKAPKFKFDINPQIKGVGKADSKYLPIKSNSLNIIMFDPPFSVHKIDNSKLIKRFSAIETTKKLFDYYNKSLFEFHRILKKNGILIFKCQDFVDGGKQYFVHAIIMNMAIKYKFYPLDLFILIVKNRIIRHNKQIHARKFHSYFWVFKK